VQIEMLKDLSADSIASFYNALQNNVVMLNEWISLKLGFSPIEGADQL
jgi:hypothetical protein